MRTCERCGKATENVLHFGLCCQCAEIVAHDIIADAQEMEAMERLWREALVAGVTEALTFHGVRGKARAALMVAMEGGR